MEGGTASSALPHFLFGWLPIIKVSLTPFLMSLWLNQGLFHSCPFKVADWMYLFSSEALMASISKIFPLLNVILVLVNKGLPMLYDGEPGVPG